MELPDPRRIKTLRFTRGPSAVLNKRARVSYDSADALRTPSVSVRLVELIDELQTAEASEELHFGLFVWPCALVLAHFVAFHSARRFPGRVVLEIGCGTALPGILAAVCGNAKKVLLSDRADSRNIQRNVNANIALNAIAHVASYLPLDWGSLALLDHVDELRQVDVILAADCFYQTEDFEKVLATVAMIFRLNPSCTFITAYQLRSITRSIAPLLAKYNMSARILDKRAFLDTDDVQGAESVYLYEIFSSSTPHA